ncbi:ATP-binding protein [Streptomyces sp. JHA26]|uniref:ATP-binding protein n=1 Tax=Streptomyces sp. JHA26 TaxID=1917143 RepID=UPI00098AECFA|nr:ATP-binding protein [Streptomyces sp. JHA26]
MGQRPDGAHPAPPMEAPRVPAPAPAPFDVGPDEVLVRPSDTLTIMGNVEGVVSAGDNATIVVVGDDGAPRVIEAGSLLRLPLRTPVPLPEPAPENLFGRDEVVERVLAQLTERRHVQLYGEDGVGKKAIARAVHRQLARRGQRGFVLTPRVGETGSLQSLYARLTEVFFGQVPLRDIDATVLRTALAPVSDVHITVYESTLSPADTAQLLETFPGCTFLFTSPSPTLPDSDAAHHVQRLSDEAATDLLGAELGLDGKPEGLRRLQFERVLELSEGRPQRLRMYGKFIKDSDAWRTQGKRGPHDRPPPVDPEQLSPLDQAQALAVTLSEPARRALVALATFGTPLSADWLAPVTGTARAPEAVRELHDRRLVTYQDDAVRITPDAAAAVRRLEDWPPADPVTAAEGLIVELRRRDSASPLPDLHVLQAVAEALCNGKHWAPASRFVGVAAPVALAGGRGRVALRLYSLGTLAAARGGLTKDRHAYARAEEQTRDLLRGDRAAVLAALAVLAPPGAQVASAGGVLGKAFAQVKSIVAAVGTKTAVTVTTVVVAAGVATGVVVANSGDDMPAGCAEAYRANEDAKNREVRTAQDLAATYRQTASDLEAAAAKATDSKITSGLRTRAAELNTEADTAEREGDGDLTGAHPDVIAALDSSKSLRAQIGTLQVIMQVCPSQD